MPARLSVLAHVGAPLEPHDLWGAWTCEPVTVALLVLSGALYAFGLRRLWRAAGLDRGIRRREALAFAVGWILLTLSLMSPLHALGGALFSAHMTQHELLMTVAAPLLIVGRPLVPFIWALSPAWRRRTGQWSESAPVAAVWRGITHPLVAFVVHGAAVWAWHAPTLYDASVTSEVVHAAQHLSFFATAVLFWWVALRGRAARGGIPASIAMLFGTTLHTGALGALLTLSSTLAYSAYAATTGPWGFTPIEDQQLGGLIMWIPGSVAYILAALVLMSRLLRDSETRVRQRKGGVRVSAVPNSPAPHVRRAS